MLHLQDIKNQCLQTNLRILRLSLLLKTLNSCLSLLYTMSRDQEYDNEFILVMVFIPPTMTTRTPTLFFSRPLVMFVNDLTSYTLKPVNLWVLHIQIPSLHFIPFKFHNSYSSHSNSIPAEVQLQALQHSDFPNSYPIWSLCAKFKFRVLRL